MKISDLSVGDIVEIQNARFGTVLAVGKKSLTVKLTHSKWKYEFYFGALLSDSGIRLALSHNNVLSIAEDIPY